MVTAVVVPGRMFGPGTPTLMYAGDAAARRGATVVRHEWVGTPPTPDLPDRDRWVAGEVAELLAGADLVIAKSLGTYAATWVDVPAIWVTPLLTDSTVVAGIERTSAPPLLVGGTADEAWDGAVARRLSPHVLEIPDPDHGLYVPGPLTASVAVLADLVRAVDAYLDTLGWT